MTHFSDYNAIDFAPPEKILRAQNTLLARHLNYCSASSPYYRQLFNDLGISPSDINVQKLNLLPATQKEDIGKSNDAFIAAGPEKIVDIVFSSGTTGIPTKVAYTDNDLQRLAYNEHKSLNLAGIKKTDSVLLTCTMDRCFVAGLAYFLGLRSLGAGAIRNGLGTLESHLTIIRRLSPAAVIGVPSFLLKLARYMSSSGLEPSESSVKRVICIGEPIRGEDLELLPMGKELENLWDASLHSTYASSETVSTFCECSAGKGGHLHPELAVLEIIGQDGRPLNPGQSGEVVITPLGTEGMPLIRFCTGDISFMIDETCDCGRRSARLGPIIARKKQMLKYKGTTLYPQTIATALSDIPQVREHYIEVESDSGLSDDITIHVAVADTNLDACRISEILQSRIRVKPDVVLETEEKIRSVVYSPSFRKPIRFFDRRKK